MIPVERYRNRREAGRILAAEVQARLTGAGHLVVLALPRGGVPVGLEVARMLEAQLDVFVVRKLGVPGHEEFAFGAIAAGGFERLDHPLIARLGLSPFDIAAIADRETAELHRREQSYRATRPPLAVHEQDVVLVDDGLATGWSMRAAIDAVRACEPRRLIVAVPVGAPDTCAELEERVDTFICPLRPHPFEAVGQWYRDFTATSDEEVRGCLATSALERGERMGASRPSAVNQPR